MKRQVITAVRAPTGVKGPRPPNNKSQIQATHRDRPRPTNLVWAQDQHRDLIPSLSRLFLLKSEAFGTSAASDSSALTSDLMNHDILLLASKNWYPFLTSGSVRLE
jgi:hypothetical protein